MKNKSRNFLHRTLFACVLLASPAAWGAVQEATIVLPPTPTRVEKFAAAELGKYLEAATGVKATVVDASATTSGTVFFVGNLGDDQSRLTQAAFPVAKLGDAQLIEEGVCIDSDGQKTLLVGKGERGALNAVYTYLEAAIGCHWPEPEHEFVPKLADWSPKPVHLVVNPQLAWRGWACHGPMTKEFCLKIEDWQAKNRMNSLQIFPGPYQDMHEFIINTTLDRGLLPNVGGHSRDFFLNGKKYIPDHPEWFAMDNGKRSEQLDYTNFDSLPTYTSNIVEYLKKYPEIKIVSLWPNDGYGFNPMTSKEKNATDVLLTYVNKLADGIHAEVPNVQCEFLAYIIYTSAPLATKPVANIIPTFCEHYASVGARDHWRPITDEVAANKALRDELIKWIGMSTQVTQFSYYGDDCIKRFLYHPLEDVMVSDCHYYKSVGMAGNFVILTNAMSWWSNAATFYAYARASWDASVTPEQIKSDYYTSLYGPAAKAMQAHADAVEALYQISPAKDDSHGGPGVGAVDIGTKNYDALLKQYADGVAVADEALDQALSATSEQWVKDRIAKLRSDTDYVSAWMQIQCGEQHMAKVKSAKLKQHLLDLIEETLKSDVMVNDDGKAYTSGNAELKRARDRLTALVTDKP
jgi:hypothetical protein